MFEDDVVTHGNPVLPLHELIRAHMQQHGLSYADLERASGRALTRGRWQQLGSGAQQRKFPDPGSLEVIAQVLEIDITTVVLAAARHLGLDVHHRAAGLAGLLPAGTDQLSERLREAILTLIRAAVAETAGGDRVAREREGELAGLRLEWPKSAAPSKSTSEHPRHG